MTLFFWGVLTTLSAVVALFFMRFWRTTWDRFFLGFASAFGVFSLHWAALATSPSLREAEHYAYLLRLGAFLLIVLAIVDKNRPDAQS